MVHYRKFRRTYSFLEKYHISENDHTLIPSHELFSCEWEVIYGLKLNNGSVIQGLVLATEHWVVGICTRLFYWFSDPTCFKRESPLELQWLLILLTAIFDRGSGISGIKTVPWALSALDKMVLLFWFFLHSFISSDISIFSRCLLVDLKFIDDKTKLTRIWKQRTEITSLERPVVGEKHIF